MTTKEVKKILKITNVTLTKYVQTGKIRVKKLHNGRYDYDEDSVLKLAGVEEDRKCVIYARVSTQSQKKSLENQIQIIKDYANSNGYKVTKVYSDIASGLSYDRGEFNELLDDVMNYKIKKVFITDKDRFTRISFDMWKELFSRFCCNIIVLNENIESEDEDKEIFSDIISLLHCFAMRMYSARRKKRLNLIKEELNYDSNLPI